MAFFYFQYGFRSSRSTTDLLTVVFDIIARVFNRSAATQAAVLDISKNFERFGMPVFFPNVNFMEFRVRYLALFFFFSVIDSFKWFWIGRLHKNIQLTPAFLKAPFLVLHFSYYRLMTFLMMLSVIFLSTLMILLSTLSVTWHLICGSN